MGIRINTNVPSLASQRTLNRTRLDLDTNLRKLASGERVSRAADDAAGLAISENLKAQIRSLNQVKRNAGDAIGLIQTAEGGLSEISSMIIRLRELAIQSSTDTLGDQERKFVNIEFQSLKDEIDRVAKSSEFNGTHLLDGSSGFMEFQIGIRNDPFLDRLRYDGTALNSTMSGLGIFDTDISSKGGAQSALRTLDDSLVKINEQRSFLGALQNRLSSTIRNIEMSTENVSAANSRIRDVDIAEESADLTKNNILLQAGTAVLGQANSAPNVALKLLNF